MRNSPTILFISALAAFSGCTTPTIPEQKRTALEQLVNSTAIDRSVENFELPQVAGKKVFYDGQYVQRDDTNYVNASIRARLSENGAHLVNEREEAEIVVEGRSGAVGFDLSNSLVGIPSLPLILPGVGGLQTPELALYKNINAHGVSKLALLGYEREAGAPLFSTANTVGKSYFYHYSFFLLININFTDIPEREGY